MLLPLLALGRASPGLTAGRGLKRQSIVVVIYRYDASPGLTAGRGLKQALTILQSSPAPASPGLTAGRGLKLDHPLDVSKKVERIARPHGRARIETVRIAQRA